MLGAARNNYTTVNGLASMKEDTGMKDSSAAAMTRFRQLLSIGLAALLCIALVSAAACGSDETATPEPTSVSPTATPAPTAEPQTGGDSDSSEHGDADSDSGGDKVEAPTANGDSGSDGEHSGQSSASSSEDKTDGGSADSDSNADGGSDSDATVSHENPNGEGMAFDNSRNVALFGAEPLNAVTWTVGPTAGMGELVAEGTLEQGLTIFNPMVDGEGSGFLSVLQGT